MYYGLIRIIATVILFLLLILFLKHFKKKFLSQLDGDLFIIMILRQSMAIIVRQK